MKEDTLIEFPPEKIYISSKPAWDDQSSKLITTTFPEMSRVPEDDGEKKLPEGLLRFLRKYERFRKFEDTYKKKQGENLPKICILGLKDKEIRFLKRSEKEYLRGISPLYSDDPGKIFYVGQKTITDDDEVEFVLLERELSSGEEKSVIEDFKYRSYFRVHGQGRLVFCDNYDEPNIIEIFDYKNGISKKLSFGFEKRLKVKDIATNEKLRKVLVITQSLNGFEKIWLLDTDNNTVEELKITDKGWFQLPKFTNQNYIEIIFSQKGKKKIVKYSMTTGESSYTNLSEIDGDIIDYNDDFIFYTNLDNKLIRWNRHGKEGKIVFPTGK